MLLFFGKGLITYAADTQYYAEKVTPGDPMDRNFQAVTWPDYCDDSGGTLIDFNLGNSIGGSEYVNLPTTIVCTGSNINWGMNGDEVTGSGTVYASMRPATGGDWSYYVTYYSTPGVAGGVWSTDPPADPTCVSNPLTRIISINPPNGTTTPSGAAITFDVDGCVDSSDIGTISGIKVELKNIDQNVLLLGDSSPNTFVLVNEDLTVGHFYFASTTGAGRIPDGNYRIRACLLRTYFGGWIVNNLANTVNDGLDCISNQFIVGSSTFIGNLSQNGFAEYQDFVAGLTATSSEAVAATCNPLGATFDTRKCITFLLVPGGDTLATTLEGLRQGVLIRFPWGYGTRMINIMSSTATGTPPEAVAIPVRISETEVIDVDFDYADLLAGGAALLDSVRDPFYDKSLRDILEPIMQLVVALAVCFIIYGDLMGSHRHNSGPAEKTGKKT